MIQDVYQSIRKKDDNLTKEKDYEEKIFINFCDIPFHRDNPHVRVCSIC